MYEKKANAISIKKRIETILANRELSQRGIAKQVGLSDSAISTWLKGTYTGDNKGVEAKLKKWLDTRDKKIEAISTLPKKPKNLPLGSYRRIHNVLDFTRFSQSIALIYGPPGVGKTHALKAYAQSENNVWYAVMHDTIKNPPGMLEEIAFKLTIRNVRRARARYVCQEIVAKMRHTGGLLIIDEGQHLQPKSLEELRYIHDETGVGLVVAGNETVYAKITGGGTDNAFAQWTSRVGKRLRLKKNTREDIAALATAMGVNGKAEHDFLHKKIASGPEALRSVVMTLQLAATIALGAKSTVNLKYIQAAWADLKGQKGGYNGR